MRRKSSSIKAIDLQIRFLEFCERNDIDKKQYFINYADARIGEAAAIAKHGLNGSISAPINGNFMTFDQLTAWMQGYTDANKLNLFK